MNTEEHQTLINALITQHPFLHNVQSIEKIETHISTVLLTGEYAYKIKKPLDLGFLNFTDLADRKRFCEAEIRLNKRLAPAVYLDTVSITGSPENPQIDQDGAAIEYAVKMRQFSQSQLFDKLLPEGKIDTTLIDELADIIANFHQNAAIADASQRFGKPENVYAPMAQNFEQIRGLISEEALLDQLDRIEAWTEKTYQKEQKRLAQRKAEGFIRECHGDMHLGNITLMDGKITIFDGIEFNDDFRWTDVISELAFITMDLTDRDEKKLAQRLMNRYLEQTGDYAGLHLLPLYQVYRAMVRAKVSAFRLFQPGLSNDETLEILAQYQSYADLAEYFMQPRRKHIILMHGVSGSGKSTISQPLLESLGAYRIRSDRERKRRFEGTQNHDGELNTGLYSHNISEQTYAHLQTLTRDIVTAGYAVIVDATFLKQAQRTLFLELAESLDCPIHIIHTHADPAILLKRIKQRDDDSDNISDATDNVLQYQLDTVEALSNSEPAITIDTSEPYDIDTLKKQLLAD